MKSAPDEGSRKGNDKYREKNEQLLFDASRNILTYTGKDGLGEEIPLWQAPKLNCLFIGGPRNGTWLQVEATSEFVDNYRREFLQWGKSTIRYFAVFIYSEIKFDDILQLLLMGYGGNAGHKMVKEQKREEALQSIKPSKRKFEL